MKKINNLKTEIFADGASIDEFVTLNNNPNIKGFTTNPSLMRKNGITNYKLFAQDLLKIIKQKPSTKSKGNIDRIMSNRKR